jgi:hypothetical protein
MLTDMCQGLTIDDLQPIVMVAQGSHR